MSNHHTGTNRPIVDTPVVGRRLFMIGPFRARLTPTPAWRLVEPPERMQAGLLIQGPDAQGVNYVETPLTSSNRCPVRLARADGSWLAVTHDFAFSLPGSAVIKQLALFDAEGQLRYAGALQSPRQGFERPEDFRFERGAVVIAQQLGS